MFLNKVLKINYARSLSNIILIPGPITTSQRVKDAMTKDIASREITFINIIKNVKKNILDLARVSNRNYECILIPGSGTYTNEAVIGSYPKDEKHLILSNGVYGERLYDISKVLDLDSKIIRCSESSRINLSDIEDQIGDEKFVSLVHHETSNGVVNNIEEIVPYLKDRNKTVLVDGISSFGGIPINIDKLDIDFFVSSSNKCLHGFPGMGFVIAKKTALMNNRSSLSLDLWSQAIELNESNQFRFTPPPQIVNALNESIIELIEEGGINVRYEQYKKYNKFLRNRLEDEAGLEPYISKENQGPIMVVFKYPYKNFSFDELYERLLKYNIVIYSAKIKDKDVFRLGNLGHLSYYQINNCINYIVKEIKEMKSANI